jgi:hypothetical protein
MKKKLSVKVAGQGWRPSQQLAGCWTRRVAMLAASMNICEV